MSSKLCAYMACLFFAIQTAYAQKIHKNCPEKNVNFRLNAEFFFKKGSFLFYESNWESGRNQVFNRIHKLPFYQMYHLVGYEIPWNDHWAMGVGIRNNYFDRLRVVALEMYANHSGKIRRFVFFKSLTFARFLRKKMPYYRLGFRVMLGRDWSIRKYKFRTNFGYDVFRHYKRNDFGEQRFIQQTNLRMGVDFFVHPNGSLGFFYDKETAYFFVDEQYTTDPTTGKLVYMSARKLNTILPKWSVRLHWKIFQATKNIRKSQRRMIF